MQEDYLLTTELARRLYNSVARELPLIDYHNHLSIADLAADRNFEDIAELWLLGDPYKHRAMRICGVPERLITGEASHWEKFKAWCAVYPKLLGGPLYDWSRMEMEEVFGIDLPICEANADALWELANEKLRLPEFSARGLLRRFNVKYAAPCAALTDELSVFSALPNVSPSLRGDDLMCPSLALIEKLSQQTDTKITDLRSFMQAASLRLDAFARCGCRFSDHALDNGFRYKKNIDDGEALFSLLINGAELDSEQKAALTSHMLVAFASEYANRGWTMQLHIGAQRYTSSTLRARVGGAGGFAAIGGTVDVASLTAMLDDMERSPQGLPRILLYTLNPADNAVMSVLSGSFPGDGRFAAVSQGPAWWWCDHLQGMREMLDVFATYSVLSTFIGMTTDSRSLLSLLRHDYFRRTLCGWIGEKAKLGELPSDYDQLSSLVRALCFENADNILKEGNINA